MRINEIETKLGLTRANIRFYEKEGLLSPARKENGYREYSDEDVAILKKIIIFRKLGLSLPTIRNILDGKLEITRALEENIATLTEQISELNGALEVCKTIQKDAPTNDSFDEVHYWELIHSKEEKGERFSELAKDYLEMEKKSFLSMWSNVFFVDLKKHVKKLGWKSILLILLAICVFRGIFQELFWPGGSFLEGFSYPFLLFGIMSLITLPIFFLHRKDKEYPPEEEKPSKHPFLIGAAKWIGGIAYMIVYLLFIPSWAMNLLLPIADDIVYYATFDLYIVYWILGMYVLVMFVYLYSKHGVFPDRITGEEGIKSNLPRKTKHFIAILSVCIWLFSLIPSTLWYDCFTENGLIVQRLFYHKTYTWDEIDYYTLDAGTDGTLTYSVIMKDGQRADCIGGGAMIGEENLPEDRYPEYSYDFVRYLSRKFTAQGVELRVDNWSKLYDDLKYESWIELAEDIRAIAGE